MAKKTKVSETASPAEAGAPRMLEHYVNVVRPQLAAALERTTPHAIPKLVQILVHMGVGLADTEQRVLAGATGALTPGPA